MDYTSLLERWRTVGRQKTYTQGLKKYKQKIGIEENKKKEKHFGWLQKKFFQTPRLTRSQKHYAGWLVYRYAHEKV